MSKYLELVEGSFTQEHFDKQLDQIPYVAYSVQDDEVIYNIIPTETPINYFYIESLEDNNVITLDSTTWAGYGDNKSKLEYSNDTTSWTSMSGVDSITINKGEYLYMRCIEGNICKDMNPVSGESYQDIMLTPLFKTFTSCNIGGNINTVMFDYTYKTEECVLSSGAFTGLFCGIDMQAGESTNYIIDASKLELPATTLAENCYMYLFYGCASLTTVPELPATELADYCYSGMFYYCTSLTTSPELPATELADWCYGYMFYYCTSLTIAPKLPAMTLSAGCYGGMFRDCPSLNHITCLATDTSASGCTDYWVSGVSNTGTFIKHPNMSDWATGNSGIPEDWTVEDAEI